MRFGDGVAALCAAFCVIGAAAPAAAQDHKAYPERVVTVIAPSAAGGQFSHFARLIASHMEKAFGSPFIVENRPGAAQRVGLTAAARARPDGYTLIVVGTTGMAVSPALHKDLPYDPANDLVPIAMIGRIPEALVVNAALPVKSVEDLAKLAKSKQGGLSFASAGPGTQQHLAGVLLQNSLGVEMIHVPYKGIALASQDVAAGHVPMMFAPVPVAMPLVDAGKMRILGVAVSERVPALPDVPTLPELGLEAFAPMSAWFMLAAPAKTPQPIIDRLHEEMTRIFSDPGVRKGMVATGVVPPTKQPPQKELPGFVRAEIERWSSIVEKAGLSPK